MRKILTPFNILLISIIAAYPIILYLGWQNPDANFTYPLSTALMAILCFSIGMRTLKSERVLGIILIIFSIIIIIMLAFQLI